MSVYPYPLLLILSLALTACGGGKVGPPWNGRYCAEVSYQNPKTRVSSEYTLTVQASDDILQRIDMPDGWLDSEVFGEVKLDKNGYGAFTNPYGAKYSVRITGEEDGCFDKVPKARQCVGKTKEGKRCRRKTDNPNGLCHQHQEQEGGGED